MIVEKLDSYQNHDSETETLAEYIELMRSAKVMPLLVGTYFPGWCIRRVKGSVNFGKLTFENPELGVNIIFGIRHVSQNELGENKYKYFYEIAFQGKYWTTRNERDVTGTLKDVIGNVFRDVRIIDGIFYDASEDDFSSLNRKLSISCVRSAS